MSIHRGPRIVKEGLALALDAANIESYPGSGGKWKDISGNGRDFDILSSTWVNDGPRSHMNFESAIAKRIVGGTLTDLSYSTDPTICMFSTVKAPNSDWKTLTRGAGSDHHVIIQDSDGTSLGMYDNDAGGFLSASVNMSTILPSRTTQFNYMCWKLSNSSPYYQFFYNRNLNTATGTITNANAALGNGFAAIGGYHNGNTDLTSFTQGWGKIAIFLVYYRHLSAAEMLQNYEAFKGRFNLL